MYGELNMYFIIEYFDGYNWRPIGKLFNSATLAWISLGNDNLNYRVTDVRNDKIIIENKDNK